MRPDPMGVNKMMVVLVYDISSKDNGGKRRLQRISRVCRDWGTPVQNSVFECEINAEQYRQLKEQISELICRDQDSVHFYLLGNRFRQRIEVLGKERILWDRELFVI